MARPRITPFSPGGKVTQHRGKGSQQAPMPDRNQITHLATDPAAGMNDYAKASPMPMPMPPSPMGRGFGE